MPKIAGTRLVKRNETFGDRVRQARKSRGMTQEDVAKKIGCTSAFISIMESGQSWPSVPTLIRIGEAVKKSPGSLLG